MEKKKDVKINYRRDFSELEELLKERTKDMTPEEKERVRLEFEAAYPKKVN